MSTDKLILSLRLTLVLAFAVLDGIDLSFNVYAVILKETFNFTQTQVEITASMGCIGFGTAFLEPVLTGMFGYATTFVVTWLALPSSCGLFAIAAVYKDVFHEWPVFVYTAQLGMNAACNIAYMAVMRVSLEIVPDNYTATFIGMFGSAVCSGKILFAGLYKAFFYNDMIAFFSCLTVLAALVLGLCYIMIYPVAIALEKQSDSGTEDAINLAERNTYVSQILNSRFFHMSFWPMTTFLGISFSILNNITSVTDSLNVKDTFNTVTVISLCIMCTRLLFGFLYDRYSSLSAGFVLLFIGYFNEALALFIGMYYLNNTTIYFVTILSGIGYGSAMYLPFAIFIHSFGLESYRFISSLFFAVSAVTMLLFQVVTGILYDAKITQNGSPGHFCYDTDCFFNSFAVLFSVTLMVMLLQAVNFVVTLCFTQNDQRMYTEVKG